MKASTRPNKAVPSETPTSIDITPPRSSTPSGAKRLIVLAGVGALAVVPPLTLSSYWLYLATLVAVYGVMTMGLSIVFGTAGQLSLAHASFVGLGAYITAVLDTATSIGAVAQLGVVVIAAILMGVVVGLPALRVSGLRLAVVTLAFGELFTWVAVRWTGVTGGEQGLFTSSIRIGPWGTSQPAVGYLFTLSVATVLTAVASRLPRTALGRAMYAVRDSEMAARSVGISLVATKLAAFVLAAVYGGIGGWLFAHHVGAISPGFFSLFESLNLLVAVILGGAASVTGAWIGAAYIVLIPEMFSLVGLANAFPFVAGALLVIVALAAPDGLVGLVNRARGRVVRPGRRKPKTETSNDG